MTVAELLARISALELGEWMAYYRLEPFGQERDNLHAGLVASAVYNVNRDPKKSRKVWHPGDFLLEFEQAPERSGRDIYQAFRAWAQLLGAKKKR